MSLFYAILLIIIAIVVFLFVTKFRMTYIFTLFVVIILLIRTGTFVVSQGSQVVITQFGDIVGDPYTVAGIYFKVPFLWRTNYFEQRIYTIPEYQADIATQDGYLITLDMVFNWKITHADRFITTMTSLNAAEAYLRNTVSGEVRQVISKYRLLEAIRSKGFQPDKSDDGLDTLLTNHVFVTALDSSHDNISLGREKLNEMMKKDINTYLDQYGMEVVGVLIRDMSYAPKVQQIIYDRMILGELRKAAKLRSKGRAEAERIKGKTLEDYQSIIAPAEQQALIIRGKAEAEATRIQAEAYGLNAHFYNLWRTLRAYNEDLVEGTQGLVLSTQSPFLHFIDQKMSSEVKSPLDRAEKKQTTENTQ